MENKKKYTDKEWDKFLELDLPDKKEKVNHFPNEIDEKDIEYER